MRKVKWIDAIYAIPFISCVIFAYACYGFSTTSYTMTAIAIVLAIIALKD